MTLTSKYNRLIINQSVHIFVNININIVFFLLILCIICSCNQDRKGDERSFVWKGDSVNRCI